MSGFLGQARFRCLSVVATFLIILIATGARAAETIWPTSGWKTTAPEDQGMRSEMLADMLEHIQQGEFRPDSLSIVRNGTLVLDADFHSRGKVQRHAIHSVTKSIISALIGIAIDKGHIAGVDVPVLSFFSDKNVANVDARKRVLTL
jgi:CubicO group peptidase (beta-lactamase class C family)